MTPSTDRQSARTGVVYALAAYGLWGVFPLYFKLLADAGATPGEVLVHRILWSAVLLAVVVSAQARWGELRAALGNPRTVLTLAVSTTLIAVNWLTFLYAISSQQVLQASLGYFLTPLMNVLLGVAILRERLRPAQLIGVGLATLGVVAMAYYGGEWPWIALILAVTFSIYGLCRKTVAVDSVLGLSIETMLLAPLAGIALAWLTTAGRTHDATVLSSGLLIFSGVATATPLLLFAGAARRLRFVTIGFLQYIGPTLQFLIAVFLFAEPFRGVQVVSFSLIWLAVAVYSIDSLLAYRRLGELPLKPALPLEEL